jgi:hypothetical protein
MGTTPTKYAMVPQQDEPATAVPDLTPVGLQLSETEVEFMARMIALLPSPRAAKKLVNLYRLVRIGISENELTAFTGAQSGGTYQVVQILLATLVGIPASAQRIFETLLASPEEENVITVFDELSKATSPDSGEHAFCALMSNELNMISKEVPLLTAVSIYQHWCGELARYSFHTRPLTVSRTQ